MRPDAAISRSRRSSSDPGPEFAKFEFDRRVLYLRRDLAPMAAAIRARLDQISAAGAPGAGNRQSGVSMKLEGAPDLFVRRSRRGGLARFILGECYCGFAPRPFQELRVAAAARRRGVPTAEPIGAMVQWIMPALYRSLYITQALAGMTLWEFVRTDDDPTVRAYVLEQARLAIEAAYQAGLFHADLNLHNLFVTKSGESFTVMLLDLDKARLFERPLATSHREANRARLLRSIRKLDREGRYFDTPALEILNLA